MNVFTSTHPILISNTFASFDIQYYFQTSPIYKYSPNLNFVFLGYICQRTNPFSKDFVNENRLFQQVIYGSDSIFGRLTHRVRFEERFIHNKATGVTDNGIGMNPAYENKYSGLSRGCTEKSIPEAV
jgi:Protein of unknown function (DUF2490)